MVYRSPENQDEGDVETGTRVCRACKARKPMVDFHWTESRRHRSRKCKQCTHREQIERMARRDEAGLRDVRADRLRREYGLTPSDVVAMRAAQNDACAICETALGGTPHIDHCHESGHVRAILCHNCNIGLGHFRDNVDLLLKAARYVTEHRTRVENVPLPKRTLTKLERQEVRRQAALRQHRSEEGQAALAIRSAAWSGEGNRAARLRAEDVVEIRRLYAAGEGSQQALADRFGITQSHVGYIIRRKAWAHVP